MTKSKTTPKKPAKAPRARRAAPSREKAAEPDAVAPDPDPAPTGKPGPPPAKMKKSTGIVIGLGDDGEPDEAETESPRRRRKITSRISSRGAAPPAADPAPAPAAETSDSPPLMPPARGKKLAPGLYWNERGMINCAEHAPYKGNDTWVFEHWKKIDQASAKEAAEKGMELACETCRVIGERQKATPATKGRRKKKEAEPPKRFSNRPSQPSEPDMTVTRLAAAYLGHLQDMGKSLATQFSYSMDLGIAKKELGGETRIEDLTLEKVAAFFESPAVTMRKNGKPKTKVTIDKTRRVFRMALAWAEEENLIAKAPLPTTTATEKK
jgi:hypothetical protein